MSVRPILDPYHCRRPPHLQDTIIDIEKMGVGDAVETMNDYGTAYDNARMLLPMKLQQQMREQLSTLNVFSVLAELKNYIEVKDDVHKVRRRLPASLPDSPPAHPPPPPALRPALRPTLRPLPSALPTTPPTLPP